METHQREELVVEWGGEGQLVVKGIESSSSYIGRDAKVVHHEAEGADLEGFTAKEMCNATEEGVGTATKPEAEEGVVVRLREIVGEREEVEPG